MKLPGFPKLTTKIFFFFLNKILRLKLTHTLFQTTPVALGWALKFSAYRLPPALLQNLCNCLLVSQRYPCSVRRVLSGGASTWSWLSFPHVEPLLNEQTGMKAIISWECGGINESETSMLAWIKFATHNWGGWEKLVVCLSLKGKVIMDHKLRGRGSPHILGYPSPE